MSGAGAVLQNRLPRLKELDIALLLERIEVDCFLRILAFLDELNDARVLHRRQWGQFRFVPACLASLVYGLIDGGLWRRWNVGCVAVGTGVTNGKVVVAWPLLIESSRMLVRCWEIPDDLTEIHRLVIIKELLFWVNTLILHVPRDVSLINSSGNHVRWILSVERNLVSQDERRLVLVTQRDILVA